MSTENLPDSPAKKRVPAEKLILPGTTIGGEVGTFFVDFVLWNRQMDRSQTLNGLVDTGATFPQAPASVLEELGIERAEPVKFRLADGSSTDLWLGHASLEMDGRIRSVDVIFGLEGSSILLGALALEAFGLAVDSRNQRLIPADILQ